MDSGKNDQMNDLIDSLFTLSGAPILCPIIMWHGHFSR